MCVPQCHKELKEPREEAFSRFDACMPKEYDFSICRSPPYTKILPKIPLYQTRDLYGTLSGLTCLVWALNVAGIRVRELEKSKTMETIVMGYVLEPAPYIPAPPKDKENGFLRSGFQSSYRKHTSVFPVLP